MDESSLHPVVVDIDGNRRKVPHTARRTCAGVPIVPEGRGGKCAEKCQHYWSRRHSTRTANHHAKW